MEVTVINDTVQEYNGVRYYLCGKYFQKNGVRLHRKVWEDHHGKVPKGYHVHHVNSNRADNNLSNLELLSGHDHLSLHQSSEEAKEYQRMQIERIRPLASEWHGSAEGREWHSKHAKETWENIKPVRLICTQCGKEYETVKKINKNHFCSANCRSEYRRLSGVDDVEAVCEWCGKVFTKNKYSKKRFCCLSCAGKYRRSNDHREH